MTPTTIIFLAVLVAAPLLAGSHRPLLWAVNGLLLAVLLAVVAARSRWRCSPEPASGLGWVLLLLALPALWMAVQALPVAPAPLRHTAWALLAPLGHEGGAISAAPSATLQSLGQYLALVAAIVLGARLLAARPGRLLAAIIGAGVVVAGLAFAPAAPVVAIGAVAMPLGFVNPNSAATFLAIGLAAASAAFAGGHVRGWLAGATGAAALGLAAGLVATESRAGLVAAAAGVLTPWVLAAGPRVLRPAVLAGVAALVLAAGAVLALTGAGETLLDATIGDVRWQLFADVMRGIADRPWTGHGAGAFADAFPAYHGAPLPPDYVWLQAHSHYLQAAFELGIPAATLLLATIGGMLVACIRIGRRSGGGALGSTAAGAAGIAVAVHAAFDFSLSVQGVALAFGALLGAGLAAAGAGGVRNR